MEELRLNMITVVILSASSIRIVTPNHVVMLSSLHRSLRVDTSVLEQIIYTIPVMGQVYEEMYEVAVLILISGK